MTLHEEYIDDPDLKVLLEVGEHDVCFHIQHLARPNRSRIRQWSADIHALSEVCRRDRKRLWAVFPATHVTLQKLLRHMPMSFSHHAMIDEVAYLAYKYDRNKVCHQQ